MCSYRGVDENAPARHVLYDDVADSGLRVSGLFLVLPPAVSQHSRLQRSGELCGAFPNAVLSRTGLAAKQGLFACGDGERLVLWDVNRAPMSEGAAGGIGVGRVVGDCSMNSPVTCATVFAEAR